MTTFFLLRHGLTDAIGNVLSGTAPGTPLNEAGRLQVRRLVERLQHVPFAAVISSPVMRARQTADPIAESHRLPVREVAAFAEYEVGGWTGRSFRDLDNDPEWRRFNAVRSLVRPPGGELMSDVQQRAVSALLDLAEKHPAATLAVVSHGDVIRAALTFFLGMPLDFFHRLDILPASISILTLDGTTPVVRQVNGDSVLPGA
jgi:probable phosphoglycerate mutase